MKLIQPGRVNGSLHTPTSKSEIQRLFACSLLAPGTSEIRDVTSSDDVVSALGMVKALGGKVTCLGNTVFITGVSETTDAHVDLLAQESGFGFRVFGAVGARLFSSITMRASGTLATRSMAALIEGLRASGILVESANGFPPITTKGFLTPRKLFISGAHGSQVLSGLLIALASFSASSEIVVTDLRSRPYIALTLKTLRQFGVSVEWSEATDTFLIPGSTFVPTTVAAEGDWSGAAFMLVLGALFGEVTVRGLRINSPQGDRVILEVLKEVGAEVIVRDTEITARYASLRPFSFDATDVPDLFPPLVALAAFIRGQSEIRGVHRLKAKESDRGKTLCHEFRRLGVNIEIDGDRMKIPGGTLRGGDGFSHHDHRVAMALAVAGFGSKTGVSVGEHECVAKSYPGFFEDLERIRV